MKIKNRISLQVGDSVRYSKRSPQHQSPQNTNVPHLPAEFEVNPAPQEPVPGSSKESHASPDISLFNRLPPEVFGKNCILSSCRLKLYKDFQ